MSMKTEKPDWMDHDVPARGRMQKQKQLIKLDYRPGDGQHRIIVDGRMDRRVIPSRNIILPLPEEIEREIEDISSGSMGGVIVALLRVGLDYLRDHKDVMVTIDYDDIKRRVDNQ